MISNKINVVLYSLRQTLTKQCLHKNFRNKFDSTKEFDDKNFLTSELTRQAKWN